MDPAFATVTRSRKSTEKRRDTLLRPNPYKSRMLHDPSYEPFWTIAEELDFSIGFHEAPTLACPPSVLTGSRTVPRAT
jgi:uncharacterized protein